MGSPAIILPTGNPFAPDPSHVMVSVAAGIFALLFVEVVKAAFRRLLPSRVD